ncbi:MAG: hypothetical protein HKN04_01125 [Rhodothermaceae bacterium]|nr:hypothetical protein [Rhodothermaceae bacterium]
MFSTNVFRSFSTRDRRRSGVVNRFTAPLVRRSTRPVSKAAPILPLPTSVTMRPVPTAQPRALAA